MDKLEKYEYAGFWIRAFAFTIDGLMLAIIIWPIKYAIYGDAIFYKGSSILGTADFILSDMFPAMAVIAFWIVRSATPGKIALGIKIVDATTGEPLKPLQAIKRYIGYYIALLPLGIGMIWVAFDRKKRGWHDIIANTVVIKEKGGVDSVSFTKEHMTQG